jgi:hypothetical protein
MIKNVPIARCTRLCKGLIEKPTNSSGVFRTVVESGHKEPDHADGDIKRTNDWSRRAPRPTP